MDEDWITILAGFLGSMFALLLVFTAGRMIDHHLEVNKCNGFGHQTNREVKWADYSFWNYECLTPTKDGKWIPTDKIREY